MSEKTNLVFATVQQYASRSEEKGLRFFCIGFHLRGDAADKTWIEMKLGHK